MNTLIILMVQTKSEAAIEILALLLVAGIIGYVTAWLYYRSIYRKNLKAVESDKHELNNRIVNLDEEIFNLKQKLSEKEEELKYLIHGVKELEAVHDKDDTALQNKRTVQLLYGKDEALFHIAQKKHLLNYNSFGTANELQIYIKI